MLLDQIVESSEPPIFARIYALRGTFTPKPQQLPSLVRQVDAGLLPVSLQRFAMECVPLDTSVLQEALLLFSVELVFLRTAPGRQRTVAEGRILGHTLIQNRLDSTLTEGHSSRNVGSRPKTLRNRLLLSFWRESPLPSGLCRYNARKQHPFRATLFPISHYCLSGECSQWRPSLFQQPRFSMSRWKL